MIFIRFLPFEAVTKETFKGRAAPPAKSKMLQATKL
jgi:hypothetical protein